MERHVVLVGLPGFVEAVQGRVQPVAEVALLGRAVLADRHALGRRRDRPVRAGAGTFSNSVVMAALRCISCARPASSRYSACTWWCATQPAGLAGSGSSTAVK